MTERPELVAVGVEEEFHTVDLTTHRLVPRAESLLQQLPPDRFVAELQRSVVETNSRPFVRLVDLAEDLAALRRGAVAAAEPLGLGVVAAGTAPLVDLAALKVTPDPRYENMLDQYQVVAREQLICGAQVHVDVGDRDMAVVVAHRLAPWTAPLLAISASSPYWLGTDTGYAGYRTLLWQRWPTTGPPGFFQSARDYDRMLDDLVRSGVISDRAMAYFDVRPSQHLPTVELRVCDACPRVEDVVLLAGLFRALVIRELDAIEAGEPALPMRPELVRGATWRAARSGLGGDLVDPVTCRPVPAGDLLHSMLEGLRPVLERTGDWELVRELTGDVLARGDSATRQREAFAAGGMDEVVELLLAETRANTEWVPGAGPDRREVTRMLAGYRADDDEAVVFDGSARGPYGLIMTALDRIGVAGLRERDRHRQEVQRRLGMTFRVEGEEEDRLFPVDLVPRVITAEDWGPLQAGLRQRVRALEAFLHDAYGERTAVRDGVLPEWVITECPGLRPEGRRVPRSAIRCAVAGIDLVRDGPGRWVVLEDNLRVPSGLGYAMANRWLAARVLPELVGASRAPSPTRALAVLRDALTAASPGLALVTSGDGDSAYYEHRLLADAMDIPLVTPDRLTVTTDGVRIDGPGGIPVQVLYRRIDEAELFDAPCGPKLLEAMEQGLVTLANAPGNGVGDDKALYAYVPRLIEYYLDERPLLDGVPTYLCRDPQQQVEVLDRLAELVVKPVDGHGGTGVLVGPDASPDELDEARKLIVDEPSRWIAQRAVDLSTHPTLVGDRLEPRAVDLRAFVVQGPEPTVVPMALTRVAPAGSRVVNSSQGGGCKDTWLPY